MEKGSREKAVRVADTMQLVARLIVLAIIIPTAVLLAVYFLLEPIILDDFIRVFFSGCIGIGLGGILLIRMKRPIFGSVLLLVSSFLGVISLSLLWQYPYAIMIAVHIFLLVNLLSANNLRRADVVGERAWTFVRNVLGAFVYLSGVFSSALFLLAQSFSLSFTIFGSMLVLAVYLLISQCLLRNLRFGIPNICIISLSAGFFGLNFALENITIPSTEFVLAGFLFSTGIGFLISSIILRRVQLYLFSRPQAKKRKEEVRQRIDEKIGIELLNDEIEEETQSDYVPPQPWLIDPYDAYALAGIGEFQVSLGTPSIFFWLARFTELSSLPSFYSLVMPIGFLLGFLFLIPAPVLMRLGEKLSRTREGEIVKSLGTIIILLAALSLFTWTQYFNWQFLYSVGSSCLLVLSGLTGIFRQIRRLWRNLWYWILSKIRSVKKWIKKHPLESGITANIIVTTSIVFFLLPSIITQPESILLLLSITVAIFSGFGVIGLALMRNIPQRNRLLGLSWMVFLFSLTTIAFWYLNNIQSLSVFDSVKMSLLILIGSAALLKLDVSRRTILPLYLPGFIIALWIAWEIDVISPILYRVLITSILAVFLSVPILLPEYRRLAIAVKTALLLIGTRIKIWLIMVGSRIKQTLIRVGSRIKATLVRIGSSIKLVVLKIGGAIYRAITFLAGLFVKFIVISYAVVIFGGLFYVGFNFMYVGLGYDILLVAISLSVVFFLLYLPLLTWKGMSKSPLMAACVLGLSISSSITAFYLLDVMFLLPRFFASISIGLAIIALGRSQFPEKVQQHIIAVTWFLLIFLTSSSFFYYQVINLGFRNTLLISIFIIGIGFLPLKFSSIYDKRVIDFLYVVCVLPSSFLVMIDLFLNLELFIELFCISIGLIVVLFPVAYKEYLRALNWIANKIIFGLKLTLMFIAVYIIAFIGVAALLLGSILIWFLWPFFQTFPLPLLPALVTLGIILIAVWLPAIGQRRSDYRNLYSSCILALGVLISFDVFVLVEFDDFLVSILVLCSLFGILLSFFSSEIHFIESRRILNIIAASSLLLLGVHLIALDIVSKLFLLVGGFSVIAFGLGVTDKVASMLTVSLSSSLLGVLFWNLYLIGFDSLILIFEYLVIESLILNILSLTRSWATWYLLAFSIGATVFVFLSPISSIAPLLAVMAIIELIRLCPDIEYRFTEYYFILDLVRAILIGFTLFILLQGILDIAIGTQLPFLIAMIVFLISSRTYLGTKTSSIITLISGIILSLLIFTFLHYYLSFDYLSTLIPVTVPLIAISIYRTSRGPFHTQYWYTLATLLVIDSGAMWYLLYHSIDSLFLSPATIILSVSIALQLQPNSEGDKSSILIAASILFFECLWTWHCYFIFAIDWMTTLLGIGFIPLFSIVYPLTKGKVTEDFELVWDILSMIAAVTTGAFLSNWNLLLFSLPHNPILTIGLILSIYPLIAIPGFAVCESSAELERAYHYAWSTSLIGWGLLFYYYGTTVSSIIYWHLSMGVIGFSLAGLVYVYLNPERNPRMAALFNLLISSSITLMYWSILPDPCSDLPQYLFWTAIIWYAVSLPTLARPTWNLGVIVVSILRRNQPFIVTIVPMMIGVLIAINSLTYTPIMMLAIPMRHYVIGLSLSFIAMGFLYCLECVSIESNIVVHLKFPGVFFLCFGIFAGVLGLGFHEGGMEFFSLIFLISLGITITFLIALPISLGFGWQEQAKSLLAIVGISIGPASFIGLSLILGISISLSLVITFCFMFLLLAPVFWEQVLKLLELIRNFGRLIMKGFLALKAAILELFEKFGYLMWTIFSIAFSVGLGILSYPFFSELMSMPLGGLLYAVPSITIPTLILGLLLMVMAIFRRRVKSTIGSVSSFLISFGAGVTIAVALYEKGYWYLSIFTTLLAFCFLGLIIQSEVDIDEKYTPILFTPIPISIGSIALYYLYIPAISFEAKMTAFVLASLIVVIIYLASTYFELVPSRFRSALWIVLSINSGLAAYTSSYMAYYDEVASIFLCFLISSWILYPVTGRSKLQLFYAPLFFSLTGFAFSIFLGTTTQSLLLALATLLYFLSRYVKEEEETRPSLVYLRIVLLLALVSCLALFGILFTTVLLQA